MRKRRELKKSIKLYSIHTSKMQNKSTFHSILNFIVLKSESKPELLVFLTFSNPRRNFQVFCDQRTNGPVNARLISWPSKAQNIQNLENIW